MKIALVHDYLSQDGGAERVLSAFHEVWPEAPIFVLFYDKDKIDGFEQAEIRESVLARLPFIKSRYRWLLPLMPAATERHNLHDFDVVLSSTSAFAKGVITRPDTLHISYCHTPTRYLWSDTHEYISSLPYNPLIKALLPPLMHKMRLWDQMSVDRVDHFIANSRTVQRRISKYYRRSSDVFYPPVDLPPKKVMNMQQGEYYISGGRLVPYKRFDLLVQTFNRLQRPLVIFGDGPEREALEAMAKPHIRFVGRIDDAEKSRLLAEAKAFLHPQIEDLGITPVEAMAHGRPVIAYGKGGVTETVIPGETGLFFKEQTWASLMDAIFSFERMTWNREKIRARAEVFGKKNFQEKIQHYVEHRYAEFHQRQAQCALDQSSYADRD